MVRDPTAQQKYYMTENKDVFVGDYGCIPYARKLFKNRVGKDTRQMIVGMLSKDQKFLGHWYYRSDQFIGNPFVIMDTDGNDIPTFVGDTKDAPREYYGNGRFKVDKEETEEAKKDFG